MSKIWSLAPRRPRSFLPPPPSTRGRRERDSKSRSLPTSAFLPFAQLPLPNSHGRGCGQGQHRGCLALAFHPTPSHRPECELHGACPPMPQGLVRAGIAAWGQRQNSPIETRRGTVSSLSLRHLRKTSPRHAPPFPASSTVTSHPVPRVPRFCGRL